jgi:hypothetical protein
MPFTIDFLDDGRVLEWDATGDGAVATEHDDYTPRFYVAARDPDADIDLTALQSIYDQHPDVVATEIVTRRPWFRRDEEPVLAVDVAHIDRITSLARQARQLKWILVACFGYQGFNNAKFGRIECHEAINAYAREILIAAKQRLEAGGWRVVHGIVDSIWVTPDPDVDDDDREDLEALATEITERVKIRLEHETHYDWVAFVPQRESDAGALTKYFGKVAGADEFKVRRISAIRFAFRSRLSTARDRAPPRFSRLRFTVTNSTVSKLSERLPKNGTTLMFVGRSSVSPY